MYGIWQTTTSIEDDEDIINTNILIELSKNRLATVSIDYEIEWNYSDGTTMQLGMTTKMNHCKWIFQNNVLSIDNSDAETDVSITNIDIKGIDEKEKAQSIEMLRENFEQQKEELVKSFGIDSVLSDEFMLISVSSKELHLSVGDDEMVFQ